MNYAEMSDFEINKAVGEIALEGKWACKPGHSGNESDSWYYGSVDTFVTPYCQLPDYCNSWADAGPIIQQNLIDLEALYDFTDESEEEIEPTGLWAARAVVNGFIHSRSEDKNPLRAAMIVFLMMQEKANA